MMTICVSCRPGKQVWEEAMMTLLPGPLFTGKSMFLMKENKGTKTRFAGYPKSLISPTNIAAGGMVAED